MCFFFFSSRRRHTRCLSDWSSDVCSSDLNPVRFYDDLIKGRTVVISFMFTSCKAICPRTSANLLKVRSALGDHVGRDVFFYSLTLDPATDSPAVLNQYARKIGVGPGWTFLT